MVVFRGQVVRVGFLELKTVVFQLRNTTAPGKHNKKVKGFLRLLPCSNIVKILLT